jgi:hypothetical protein
MPWSWQAEACRQGRELLPAHPPNSYFDKLSDVQRATTFICVRPKPKPAQNFQMRAKRNFQMRWKFCFEQGGFHNKISALLLAGAGGIEPCNNPLPHKDFSIPARPLDSIFDSKAKALVGMTDDEVAYIEAKGWKASVVPELSIIHHFAKL